MKRFVLLAVCLSFGGSAMAGTIVLRKKWIEDNKNRATIKAAFNVDHAHPNPNPAKKDGDIHASGRSPKDVGLPMVAEVMNAAGDGKAAMVQVHKAETEGTTAQVIGAWRVWFEHPGTKQIQFDKVPVPTDTNPDHSFEVHPILSIDGVSAADAFHDIKGFTKKKAEDAFGQYEKQSITVADNNTAVALTAKKVGFNYVEFQFTALGKPVELDDKGLVISANVEAEDSDEDLAKQVPMIFVPNTPPWKAAQKIDRGSPMHVIGIPRVSLKAISEFISASRMGRAASKHVQATRKLPYEMIVVAVLP
jgi:hypothetical protein